jgi:hypothetical protein
VEATLRGAVDVKTKGYDDAPALLLKIAPDFDIWKVEQVQQRSAPLASSRRAQVDGSDGCQELAENSRRRRAQAVRSIRSRDRTPVGRCESYVSCVRFNDVRRVMTRKRRRQAIKGINRMSRTLRHKCFYSALLGKFPPAYDYLPQQHASARHSKNVIFVHYSNSQHRLAIAD